MKMDTDDGASSCVTPRTAGGHQAGRGRGFPEPSRVQLIARFRLVASSGGEGNKVALLRTTKSGDICYGSLGCFLNYLCSAELLTLRRAQHTRLPPWMLVWHQAGQSRDSLCLNGTFGAHPRMRERADTHRRKLLRITHPDFGSELASSTSSRLGGFLVVWAKISLFFWR